ncbi:hypothetical protein WNZ14_18065 [Hoeflea sp. AS60]|uniref:hypothetical protein n=1 Tax=Hoeflea sp. AS60 TaxID=3135780 RepID=UPI0031806E5C
MGCIEFDFKVGAATPQEFSPVCECFSHCIGQTVGATLFAMKKSIRHLPGRGHLFLVMMLVFASIVPGALHAAMMAGSGAVANDVHHATEQAPTEHSMMSHHQAGDVHHVADQDSHPQNHHATSDQCCPVSCSFAICSPEPERAAVFVADSFEIEPMLGFDVMAMALPDRPPRA